MKWRYAFAFGSAVILGLAVFIAATALTKPYTFKGSKIEPMTAPDFELTDAEGNSFRLSEHRGKVVLMFFGYTNCPDVCPTTLVEFKQVRKMLGERADQVVFLFITVDPDRDTPERLGEYVTSFEPAVIGLTGEMAALEKVWADYYVTREVQKEESAAGYLMAHSTRTYIIDREGMLRATYFFGSEPESIVQDTRYLLEN